MGNGSSFQGNDLKVTLDFKIVHPTQDTPEMKFLHDIVQAKKIELLKHPICESFLHMKWIQVRKYFYSYFMMYLLFLLTFNSLIFLDLSPVIKRFDPDIIANYALPLLFTLVFLLGFFLMKNFALIAYSPLKYFGNP